MRSVRLQDNQECCLCLSDLANGDKVAVLGCSPLHILHSDCLEGWKEHQRNAGEGAATCPLCRAPIDDARVETRVFRGPAKGGEAGASEFAAADAFGAPTAPAANPYQPKDVNPYGMELELPGVVASGPSAGAPPGFGDGTAPAPTVHAPGDASGSNLVPPSQQT